MLSTNAAAPENGEFAPIFASRPVVRIQHPKAYFMILAQ